MTVAKECTESCQPSYTERDFSIQMLPRGKIVCSSQQLSRGFEPSFAHIKFALLLTHAKLIRLTTGPVQFTLHSYGVILEIGNSIEGDMNIHVVFLLSNRFLEYTFRF